MRRLRQQTSTAEEDARLLERCGESIRALDLTASVVLYGSRARGEGAEDSDFDLLVLTDREANLAYETEIRNVLFPIEMETGSVLSFFACNRKTWDSALYRAMPFHLNVEKDGVIV